MDSSEWRSEQGPLRLHCPQTYIPLHATGDHTQILTLYTILCQLLQFSNTNLGYSTTVLSLLYRNTWMNQFPRLLVSLERHSTQMCCQFCSVTFKKALSTPPPPFLHKQTSPSLHLCIYQSSNSKDFPLPPCQELCARSESLSLSILKGRTYKITGDTWIGIFAIDDWDDKENVWEGFYHNMHLHHGLIHLFHHQQGQIRDLSLSVVLKGLTALVLCPNRPITWHLIWTEGHNPIAAMKFCLLTACVLSYIILRFKESTTFTWK